MGRMPPAGASRVCTRRKTGSLFLPGARPFGSPPLRAVGWDQGLKAQWPLSPVTVYAAYNVKRIRVSRKRVAPRLGPGCVERLARQNETVWNSLRASSEGGERLRRLHR